MKIASILPYKENYTKNGAGAASLWIKDFMSFSRFRKDITVFGFTTKKDFLTKNYINIKINTFDPNFLSTTKRYSKKLLEKITEKNFDIIEIHNRPIMVKEFLKKINSKIILYFHNDPRNMKGSKTPKERLDLIQNVDKIVFISKWVKEKFFEGINNKFNNKTDIIYHSINKSKKFKKKKKQIIFVGKLNNSKGYDLYCAAIKIVLEKFKEWKAYSIGEEKRFQHYETHKNQINLGQLPHSAVLKTFEESEIAVLPSRWEEPFGRTSLEASSRGCATIISNKGGLPETTDHAIILNQLDVKNIVKEISYLILNNTRRKQLQKLSFSNIKHGLKQNSVKIDDMRSSLFPFSKVNFVRKNLRILNIYNLGQKLNHRLYNLSIGKKLTNGFIRNGHDVIEISDRDYIKQNKSLTIFNNQSKFDNYILETFKNYNPDLILFGHSEYITPELIMNFKNLNKDVIVSHWNEDPFLPNINNSNIIKLKKYLPFVDHTFITTDPNSIKSIKKNNHNLHFFMTPVDKNIECFDVFNLKPQNDLFYAMSHGVNRAKLKSGKIDDRVIFLNKLVLKLNDIKYDFYGYNKLEPIWGNEFYRALINSKMALNLSRGNPTKYYSSNRIASLVGNGLLVFVDEKIKFNNFFTDQEIVFYNSINDLSDKIKFYSKNDHLRKKIARNGKIKYFDLFNEKKIAKFFIDNSLGKKNINLI